MNFLSNRSICIIKELLGNNRELHSAIAAISAGSKAVGDVDLIFAELSYYVEKHKQYLNPTALEDAYEALRELRNLV